MIVKKKKSYIPEINFNILYYTWKKYFCENYNLKQNINLKKKKENEYKSPSV